MTAHPTVPLSDEMGRIPTLLQHFRHQGEAQVRATAPSVQIPLVSVVRQPLKARLA